jgi:parallel beta-helix repeat protein
MRLAFLPVLLLAVLASRTEAAESYDACAGFIDTVPATITTQGTWCLRADVGTGIGTGEAILVAANNVTIDCNGFKIGGLSAGATSQTNGIAADTRMNTTVRGCTIRGFRHGVYIENSNGALVEDNLIDGSLGAGIVLDGDGGTIRRNRVVDTGAPADGNDAYGIRAIGLVDVLDNTVAGVEQTLVHGISVTDDPGGTIEGNRVRSLAGATVAIGINASSAYGALVRDNHLRGPGVVGVRCVPDQALVVGNAVSSFDTAIDPACAASGNATQDPPN